MFQGMTIKWQIKFKMAVGKYDFDELCRDIGGMYPSRDLCHSVGSDNLVSAKHTAKVLPYVGRSK